MGTRAASWAGTVVIHMCLVEVLGLRQGQSMPESCVQMQGLAAHTAQAARTGRGAAQTGSDGTGLGEGTVQIGKRERGRVEAVTVRRNCSAGSNSKTVHSLEVEAGPVEHWTWAAVHSAH